MKELFSVWAELQSRRALAALNKNSKLELLTKEIQVLETLLTNNGFHNIPGENRDMRSLLENRQKQWRERKAPIKNLRRAFLNERLAASPLTAARTACNPLRTNFMLTLPQRLNPGDTIGLIAPASAPVDPRAIDKCVTAIEAMGFKAKLARNVRKRLGFIAGSDRDRAADIMQMFADSKVNGILCVRGGYGTGRLLNLLDYSVIRKNPKVFAGYSDITALHCAFAKYANLLSFHSPMAASDFIKEPGSAFARKSFLAVLTEPKPYGSIRRGYTQKTVSILRKGKVSGELAGGNICLLATLIGTRFQPDFKNKILFFEDVDEEPFRYDRMITHLLNAGVLQQVAGIAIGQNTNCEDPKAKTMKEYRQPLMDVFRDRLLPLKVPIVAGLPFGHVPDNATIPVGGRATLDAVTGDLIITSAAVK